MERRLERAHPPPVRVSSARSECVVPPGASRDDHQLERAARARRSPLRVRARRARRRRRRRRLTLVPCLHMRNVRDGHRALVLPEEVSRVELVLPLAAHVVVEALAREHAVPLLPHRVAAVQRAQKLVPKLQSPSDENAERRQAESLCRLLALGHASIICATERGAAERARPRRACETPLSKWHLQRDRPLPLHLRLRLLHRPRSRPLAHGWS